MIARRLFDSLQAPSKPEKRKQNSCDLAEPRATMNECEHALVRLEKAGEVHRPGPTGIELADKFAVPSPAGICHSMDS
jgi:hypothetical protein